MQIDDPFILSLVIQVVNISLYRWAYVLFNCWYLSEKKKILTNDNT